MDIYEQLHSALDSGMRNGSKEPETAVSESDASAISYMNDVSSDPETGTQDGFWGNMVGRIKGAWSEGKHKRDASGRFSSTGGGGQSGKPDAKEISEEDQLDKGQAPSPKQLSTEEKKRLIQEKLDDYESEMSYWAGEGHTFNAEAARNELEQYKRKLEEQYGLAEDSGFEESDHPREAKGGKGGGRFRTSGKTIEKEDAKEIEIGTRPKLDPSGATKCETRARVEKHKTDSGEERYSVEREYNFDGRWHWFASECGLSKSEAERSAEKSDPEEIDNDELLKIWKRSRPHMMWF